MQIMREKDTFDCIYPIYIYVALGFRRSSRNVQLVFVQISNATLHLTSMLPTSVTDYAWTSEDTYRNTIR